MPQCAGKRLYFTELAAVAAGLNNDRINKKYGKRKGVRQHSRAYQCVSCGGWHLTTKGRR